MSWGKAAAAFNPRPCWGVTPCGFSKIAKKRRRSATVFAYLINHHFRTFSENIVPKSSQVRSPFQIKWPYRLKSLRYYSGYSFGAINMKLPGYHKTISVTSKRISWIFDFSDLRSGQFCDIPIIRQWRKTKSLIYASGPFFIMNWVLLRYCWWSRCTCWLVTFLEVIWGHPKSPTGFCYYLTIEKS